MKTVGHRNLRAVKKSVKLVLLVDVKVYGGKDLRKYFEY